MAIPFGVVAQIPMEAVQSLRRHRVFRPRLLVPRLPVPRHRRRLAQGARHDLL